MFLGKAGEAKPKGLAYLEETPTNTADTTAIAIATATTTGTGLPLRGGDDLGLDR